MEGLRFSKVFKEGTRGDPGVCRGGEGVESEIESIGLLIAVTWLPLRFLVNLGGRGSKPLDRRRRSSFR